MRFLMRALLAQMFPDLVSLTISTCSDINQSRNNVEPGDNEMSQWPSIKEVRFQGSGYTDVAIMELENIFPNLRCLEICLDEPGRQYFPFRQIWSSLQLLEELTISGKLKGNFDAEFCGIYPQEATLLRREDDEYLRTVNIVPLFSPVTHVRGKAFSNYTRKYMFHCYCLLTGDINFHFKSHRPEGHPCGIGNQGVLPFEGCCTNGCHPVA